VALLNRVVGSVSTWLPIMAFFQLPLSAPVASPAGPAGRALQREHCTRSIHLYSIVFTQVTSLCSSATPITFAVKSVMRSLSSPSLRWFVPALWWAALTSLSPHFAWIYGLVILGVVIVALSTKQQPLRRVAAWFATSVCAFILMSAYIILPNGSTTLPTQVGSVSLNIYRTNGDPHLGLFANVAALYGFWRTGPGPNFPRTSLLDGRSLCSRFSS